MLGDDVVIHVMEIVGNSVRVGIQAPRSLPVYREEIWDAVRAENRAAAAAMPAALPAVRPAACPPCLFCALADGYGASGSSRTRPRSEEQDMAPRPFRRRRKATRIARNLALAEAALAMAMSRVGATGGAVKSGAGAAGGAVKGRGRLLLAGTAVLAAGAVALLKRDKVAQVLPSRSGAEPVADAPPPPQQSNSDAPGPVANTATPIPVAPDPAVRPGTDAGESTPTG